MQASRELSESVTDSRYQRAVSLPIGDISRHSALGSHAPLEMAASEKEVREDNTVPERPKRPRRATLPSVIGPTPESLVDSGYHEYRQSFHDTSQPINPSDVGVAVTSGSNPRRRSRSVDAFGSVRDSLQLSPVQWRTGRRRSDEIQYWRNSVAPMPNLEHSGGNEIGLNDEVIEQPDKTFELAGDTAPAVFFDNNDEGQEKATGTDRPDSDNRDTFDFGMLASTMRQEENIPIEERLVTVEVKLMDLEYAISKLQAGAPPSKAASMNPPTLDADPSLETSNTVPAPRSIGGRQSPNSASKSHIGSSTTTSGSVSTQLTSLSIVSPPQHSQLDDPFVDDKTRPTSNATTIRQVPISPIPSERFYPTSEPRPRSSITGVTIDHITTLISLIRTEQAARHRLESQIDELQRQVKTLQHQLQQQQQPQQPSRHSPTSVSSFSRPRGWTGDRRDGSLFRGYNTARRVPSYDDTTSTDDGFQDVYETPIEQKRGEFEGGVFNGAEGEAF